ncbi:hypothetical protein, partial [Nocardia brasiliensis]|uniref:hypothetical protein n=1 Tax=Nocardia brasiliensis TaxID=37326 RepID=UPI0024548567
VGAGAGVGVVWGGGGLCPAARPVGGRGGDGTPAKQSRQLEADVLLSTEARLGGDGAYRADGFACGAAVSDAQLAADGSRASGQGAS